ncbi:MAG: GNAT family N-acetyltransferase [Acidimicrobiales bacterium]
MSLSVEVRDARADEFEVLRGVYRRSSLSVEATREVLLALPDVLVLPARIDGATSRVAVGDDGRILGFATGVRTAAHVELDDLFVEPELQRRGVGRALIEDIATGAWADGMARVEVTANPAAEVFYAKTGFVAVGDVATEFGLGVRMVLELG